MDDQSLLRMGFALILDGEDDIEVVGEASDGAEAVRMVERAGARRGADGCADAGAWTASRPPAPSRPRRCGGTDHHPDHLRPGRVRLCGPAGRGQRLPAQGRGARGAGPGDPAGELAATPWWRRGSPSGCWKTLSAPRPDARPCPATRCWRTSRPASSRCWRPSRRGSPTPRSPTQLFLSEATVKTHVRRILTKLHLRDRVQVVVYAYETGLVTPSNPDF